MSKERYSYDEITFDIFDTTNEEYPTMRKICNTLNQQSQRIAELEKQLAEKEKEIERLKVYDEYRFELPYPKVKILGKTFEDIQELLDKWLEQGSKDKISFAVEQFEKVKELMRSIDMPNNPELYNNDMFGAGFDIHYLRVEELIDNQIKQLKEMK